MDENKDFDSFIYELKEESIRKKIILIELLSILFTLISCIVSGYFWITSGSMVALAVSADSFLDILAYLTIIWRYFKPSDLNSIKRDVTAQIVISILFVLTAIFIEFESFKKFILIIKPKPNYSFILISVFQSIIFSFISIVKFKLCKNLKLNSCLFASGVNSLMAAFGLFSMALSMSIFVYNPDVWMIDSILGFIMGIVLFIYGTKLLFTNFFFY
jgi:hypothetical protein